MSTPNSAARSITVSTGTFVDLKCQYEYVAIPSLICLRRGVAGVPVELVPRVQNEPEVGRLHRPDQRPAIQHLREWADGWLAHMEPGKYAVAVDVAAEKSPRSRQSPMTCAWKFETLFATAPCHPSLA